jgi:hypothetical protein
VRLTAQEFGDRDFQRRSRALDEVQRRVWCASLVIINHLPRDIEAFGQFSLRQSFATADGSKPLAEQGSFSEFRRADALLEKMRREK